MSISVKQFQDALAKVSGEYDLKCESNECRAGPNDIVNGVIIAKSRMVSLRTFKQDYLAQAFRTLLNEMIPPSSSGRLVSCLPVLPEWAADSASFRDEKTGVMFEVYKAEQAGAKIMSIAATWGAA